MYFIEVFRKTNLIEILKNESGKNIYHVYPYSGQLFSDIEEDYQDCVTEYLLSYISKKYNLNANDIDTFDAWEEKERDKVCIVFELYKKDLNNNKMIKVIPLETSHIFKAYCEIKNVEIFNALEYESKRFDPYFTNLDQKKIYNVYRKLIDKNNKYKWSINWHDGLFFNTSYMDEIINDIIQDWDDSDDEDSFEENLSVLEYNGELLVGYVRV